MLSSQGSFSSHTAQVIGFLHVGELLKSRPNSFMRVLELGHDVFTDGTEGSKNAFAFIGDGFEVGNSTAVEVAIEDIYR